MPIDFSFMMSPASKADQKHLQCQQLVPGFEGLDLEPLPTLMTSEDGGQLQTSFSEKPC